MLVLSVDCFFYIKIERKKKSMLNQFFIEGVVSKRKQGAMEVCLENGTTVVKMTIKHFIKETDVWEVYGVLIHGDLAAEVQKMSIEVGSRILVTGKAQQKCFTNELTGEATSYFIIDTHDLSVMGSPVKKEGNNNVSTVPIVPDVPLVAPSQDTIVQQVSAKELPFPVAE